MDRSRVLNSAMGEDYNDQNSLFRSTQRAGKSMYKIVSKTKQKALEYKHQKSLRDLAAKGRILDALSQKQERDRFFLGQPGNLQKLVSSQNNKKGALRSSNTSLTTHHEGLMQVVFASGALNNKNGNS